MKAIRARITRALPLGSEIETCDNSGAKLLKIFTVMGYKSVEGRSPSAGVGDLVMASVKKGRPDMRKQVVLAVIVRQKKEWRRLTGERISFSDNAVAILKDEKGEPKGTHIKGPIAREISERWPSVAKLASIIV